VTGFARLVTPAWVQILGGWRALGFAVCAAVALCVAGWQYAHVKGLKASLARSQERVVALEAEKLAANLIAEQAQARADAAVAAEAVERAKRVSEAKARERKWSRINEAEKAWSEQPVPDAVWSGLGQ
jgi:hypothetical protein